MKYMPGNASSLSSTRAWVAVMKNNPDRLSKPVWYQGESEFELLEWFRLLLFDTEGEPLWADRLNCSIETMSIVWFDETSGFGE